MVRIQQTNGKINVMEVLNEPLDQIADALREFFARTEGGYNAVAKAIDVNPQRLYYIISGRNKPTLETVLQILHKYPEETKLHIAMGLGRSAPVLADITAHAPLPPSEDAGYWRAKYYEVENKLANVEGQLKSFTAQIAQVLETNEVLKKLIHKLDPTLFKESDSQFTVYPMPRNLIGFVQQSTDCIVRMHPATAANLRMLNSRASAVSVEG